MKSVFSLSFAIALLFASVCAAQDEKKDSKDDKKSKEVNPVYTSWEKHPIGTTITLATKTKTAGKGGSSMKMTSELVKKDDEKVVVKMSTVIVAAGREITTPGREINIEKYGRAVIPGRANAKFAKEIGRRRQRDVESFRKEYQMQVDFDYDENRRW